jgi:hypothetical protein
LDQDADRIDAARRLLEQEIDSLGEELGAMVEQGADARGV